MGCMPDKHLAPRASRGEAGPSVLQAIHSGCGARAPRMPFGKASPWEDSFGQNRGSRGLSGERRPCQPLLSWGDEEELNHVRRCRPRLCLLLLWLSLVPELNDGGEGATGRGLNQSAGANRRNRSDGEEPGRL